MLRRPARSGALLVAIGLLAACGAGPPTTSDAASSTTTAGAAPTTTTAADPATTERASRSAAAAASARDPVVVGLGNSVPSGAACSCQSFVAAYAQLVAAGTGTKATVDNDAVSGSTSADVVNLLARTSVQAHLRAATTVLIMTGANDFNDAFDEASLGGPADQLYGPVATAVQENLTTVVEKIHGLNAAAHVIVLDYWAAMEDGAVAAQHYDAQTMAAAVASTTYVNQALAVATKAADAMYVSTYTAMKGADGKADPTALLAPDGDHPNAAGHQVIARAVYAALPGG
jgi:lysophospholipase L1-like esterase